MKSLCATIGISDIEIKSSRSNFINFFQKERKQKAYENFNPCLHIQVRFILIPMQYVHTSLHTPWCITYLTTK